jgi:hypothetical protein
LSDNASITRNACALGLSEDGFRPHSRVKRDDLSDPERFFALPDERPDDFGMHIVED